VLIKIVRQLLADLCAVVAEELDKPPTQQTQILSKEEEARKQKEDEEFLRKRAQQYAEEIAAIPRPTQPTVVLNSDTQISSDLSHPPPQQSPSDTPVSNTQDTEKQGTQSVMEKAVIGTPNPRPIGQRDEEGGGTVDIGSGDSETPNKSKNNSANNDSRKEKESAVTNTPKKNSQKSSKEISQEPHQRVLRRLTALKKKAKIQKKRREMI